MNRDADLKKSCSFCNESFSSSPALEEHLLICGNRTDQCPNCRKFIRRAIFAYHYENNCANLDDPASPETVKFNSFQTNQPKVSNTIPCQFCRKDFHVNEYMRHQDNCPDRRTSAMPQNTNYSNQNPSFDNQLHHGHDTFSIPCEFCGTQVNSTLLTDHEKDCFHNPRNIANQASSQTTTYPYQNPPIGNQPQNVFGNRYVPCRFCDALMAPSLLTKHEGTCDKRRNTPQTSNWNHNQNISEQFKCMICGKISANQRSHTDHQRDCARKSSHHSYGGHNPGGYYSPRYS